MHLTIIMYFFSTAAQNCTNGTFRLVDRPLENAGRVEICINGVWKSVCDNYPDSYDTGVVCRQLVHTNKGEVVHW